VGTWWLLKKVKPMLEAVAAKANGIPCFAYMGNGAAGHFVKMVHNGIEYAMMQMISEAYDLLKRGAGFSMRNYRLCSQNGIRVNYAPF
jgi:6-phosphogluconate dehydrogenase